MKRTILFFTLFLSMNFSLLASTPVWDYDGDGKTDLVIARTEGDYINGYLNRFYILKSRDGFYSIQWGASDSPQTCHSNPVGGDFDGDGKFDIAIAYGCINNAPVYYYILNSSDNTMRVVHWGLGYDQRMLEDFDGDGKTDFGVYRDGWWYILNSSDGSFRAEKFGGISGNMQEDFPVHGDYDGDGKADLAVARASQSSFPPATITLYVKLSGSGNLFSRTFGDRWMDYFVPGDYDGDGKTDVAIYGGNAYGDKRFRVIRSSDGLFDSYRFSNPSSEDRPVPGDYDGDGKTDFAIYRRGQIGDPQTYFYIQGSSSGFQVIPWGNHTIYDYTPMTLMNSR